MLSSGAIGFMILGVRRDNEVSPSAQRANRGRNAVPRGFTHDDRIVARASGSLGKMGHVGLTVRPGQTTIASNSAIRAHGRDEFEC